jgi:anti-sigma B factor antagonist
MVEAVSRRWLALQLQPPFHMMYSLAVSQRGPMRLTINGELDACTVGAIRLTLDRVVARDPLRLEIDLSNLRMIDSIGVGTLVGFCKRLRASGCALVIQGLREQPLAVIRLLKLDRALFGASGDSAHD